MEAVPRRLHGLLRVALAGLATGALAALLLGGISMEALGNDSATRSGENSDSIFLDVSRRVPEFGGAYIDGSTVYIWLTRPTDELRDRAYGELVATGGSEFEAGNEIVALKGDYSFEQLYRWHGAAADVLTIEGVILTDIDERTNRLVVQVENRAKQGARVQTALSESGVPEDAVRVVKGTPIRPAVPGSRTPWLAALAGCAALVALAVSLSILRRRLDERSKKNSSEIERVSDPNAFSPP